MSISRTGIAAYDDGVQLSEMRRQDAEGNASRAPNHQQQQLLDQARIAHYRRCHALATQHNPAMVSFWVEALRQFKVTL